VSTTISRVRQEHRTREAAVLVVLLVLLVAAAAATLLVDSGLSGGEIAATLRGEGSSGADFIILQLRLPRLLLGIVVGVAFGLAGAVFQSLLANPLASPDIIGITGGASAGAVLAMIVGGASGIVVSGAAFLGALVVAAAISALAYRNGLTGLRFVLIGVAFAFVVRAVLGYLLTRSDVRDAQSALVWLVGSLGTTRWSEVALAAGSIAVLVPTLALLTSRLRILQLGDDTARGLGVRVEGSRIGLIAVAVALAAVGTAAAGPIAFVPFVAAPIARRLAASGGLALVLSAVVGSLIVVVSDLIAQHALPDGASVPVGVVTGVIGAPYLLFLIARGARGRSA
jgi:iron complex transport system permease protein